MKAIYRDGLLTSYTGTQPNNLSLQKHLVKPGVTQSTLNVFGFFEQACVHLLDCRIIMLQLALKALKGKPQ